MSETNTNGEAGEDESEEYQYDPDEWDPTKSHLQFQALKSTNQGGATPLQEWHIATEKTTKVQDGGNSYFKGHIGACAVGIVNFCASNTTKKPGGGFGDQATIEDFGGTITIDYQGLRENQGYCWFDFQGQVGGGSSKRKTYFEVMVLQDGGEGPSQVMIEQAIRESLKGGVRSIVVLRTVRARPK